jgi:hypothetical protein
MKMVSMIMVLIMHDGVRDDVDDVIDDVDDVIDDVDDDVIEGKCELRWHWQKLEYAVSKMIMWMKLSMKFSMIIVLITHDGVCDDADDVDDVDDDVIEGIFGSGMDKSVGTRRLGFGPRVCLRKLEGEPIGRRQKMAQGPSDALVSHEPSSCTKFGWLGSLERCAWSTVSCFSANRTIHFHF